MTPTAAESPARTIVHVRGEPSDYFVVRDQYDAPVPVGAAFCLHVWDNGTLVCQGATTVAATSAVVRVEGQDFEKLGVKPGWVVAVGRENGLPVSCAKPAEFGFRFFPWCHFNSGKEATQGLRMETSGAAGEYVTVLYPGTGERHRQDGKFICHGGFEVGFRIDPNGSNRYLPESDPRYPNVAAKEILHAGAGRCDVHATSSPLSYRCLMGGALARIGLDFWPVITDARGRRSSVSGCPLGEAWLWRGYVASLTAPGPDGAVRTSRGQMFLEGVQECELSMDERRGETMGLVLGRTQE